jgi:hypothetical protein
MTDNQKAFDIGTAERIQTLRLKSGRTEAELSTELGLTIQAYCDLEYLTKREKAFLYTIGMSGKLAKVKIRP